VILKACLCGLLFPQGGTCSCKAANKRGLRTKGWVRLRREHLEGQPYCGDCLIEGHYTTATQVHHLHKRSTGGALLTHLLMSLCAPHHSKRTAHGE
jgi:5-methylcytosine-specific restriction endonuclease McrA